MTDAGKEDWIEWKGGENPIPGEPFFEVRRRDGREVVLRRQYARWDHANDPSDIIAYRLAASGEAATGGYAGVKDAEVNNSLPTQGVGAGDRETLRQALVYARYHVELSPASDKAEALAKIDAALQAAPSEGGEPVSDMVSIGWLWHSLGGTTKLTTWHPGEMAETAERLYVRRPPAPSEEPLVGWRPIETAPKDGTEFIAYRPDQGVFVCRFAWLGEFINDSDPTPYDEGYANWFHDRWGWLENDLTPTHWMPLPAAPAPDAIRGGS